MIGCRRPGRADAHRAHEGLDRDRDVLAQVGHSPAVRSKIRRYGIGEVLGQEAEPGQDRGPPPALGAEIEDLHRQRVARLGSATAIGPASG